MNRKSVYYALVTVLVLIAIGWGIILYLIYSEKRSTDFYGNIYEGEAPEFVLTSHSGDKVQMSDFKGDAVLLFFGYTNCPDICPVTMGTLRTAANNLGEYEDRVKVLFISIDPERDDVEKLSSYVPYFGQNFIGLTGTPEQIEQVADDYHAFYMKEESDSESGYLMGHTSSVFLINPEGQFVLRYPQNLMDPVLIAEDIKRIL